MASVGDIKGYRLYQLGPLMHSTGHRLNQLGPVLCNHHEVSPSPHRSRQASLTERVIVDENACITDQA